MAHHPYSFPTNPLEAHDWNAYTQTQTIYDVMVAHGDAAKKVWGTEMGAPTGTASKAVSETTQAQFVRDYFTGWNTTFRVVHRTAGDVPPARQQQRPVEPQRQLRPDAPRPQSQAGVRRVPGRDGQRGHRHDR